MPAMTIGELARRGGVGIETVRYYQRRRLIPEPPRRSRGFREYSEETLTTLRFIRRAKGLGFSLKEIGELLRLRAGFHKGQDSLLDIIAEKRADLARRVKDLEIAIGALERLSDEMRQVVEQDRWALLDPDASMADRSR
jgi:MerR family mercuric resistance operon transcriptional regulator